MALEQVHRARTNRLRPQVVERIHADVDTALEYDSVLFARHGTRDRGRGAAHGVMVGILGQDDVEIEVGINGEGSTVEARPHFAASHAASGEDGAHGPGGRARHQLARGARGPLLHDFDRGLHG